MYGGERYTNFHVWIIALPHVSLEWRKRVLRFLTVFIFVICMYWAEDGSWKPVAKYTFEVNADILQVPVLPKYTFYLL